MTDDADLQIVWFKRDLRVADHRALAQAAQQGPVLPLFVVEPDLWRQSDMSGRQWEFVAECLTSLREELSFLGQPLVVRIGDVVETLDCFFTRFRKVTLWSHQETGNAWTFSRDKRVDEWRRRNGVVWHEISQSGVVRRLRTRNGWANKWDAFMAEPVTPPPTALQPLQGVPAGPIPLLSHLGIARDACPQRQRGGRRAAMNCLHSFLTVRGRPYRRAMSSPMAAAEHCSRISPHLAWGTLSIREVAQAVWKRQIDLKQSGVKNSWLGSMSSFQGRLHWRDHFIQKLEDQPDLEFHNMHGAYDGIRSKESDAAKLSAWSLGETGLPFVDACMRSLMATGWMNFRMRAMLMAVASYHLWLDWRAPGERLARLFTDYEPGIHWPQVQMQSGTTGINTVRIYNPIKQGYDQDPGGVFIRQWVPELADVPSEFIHEPWRWEGAQSFMDKTYPSAIVDHLASAKEARRKIWAVRHGEDYSKNANAIQNKHGSRRSGIQMRGRGKREARSQLQLSLPLGPR